MRNTPLLFLNFSLFLSRACLGKMIVFVYKLLHKGVFRRGAAAVAGQVPRRADRSRFVRLLARNPVPAPGTICANASEIQTGCRPFLSARLNVETAGFERQRPEI